MSSKTHKNNLSRAQKKKELERLNEELNKIQTQKDLSIDVNNRDITSLRHKLTPLLELTKSDTLSNHYRELLKIYQQNNYHFTTKTWAHYAFNPFALIFGPIYFAFNRLYMGLFLNIMLMLIIAPLILAIPYTPAIVVFIVGNVLCALTADFFIVHKAVSELDKHIKNKKLLSEYDILRQSYLTHTKFRLFHMFFGIVFVTWILYGTLALINTDFDKGILSGFEQVEKILIQQMQQQ